MKLHLAYFGSPDFSAHVLERIIKEIPEVSADLVVTQPDRPVGRKHILTPTPVKLMAQKYSIQTHELLRGHSFRTNLGALDSLPESRRAPILSEKPSVKQILANCDLALVFAYGQIIPDEILKLPKYGFWNIHPSLLPEFRGPTPLIFPILLGYPETGVTLMQMDAMMDHGPVIAQQKLTIDPEITHDLLLTQASDVGFELLKREINNLTLDACNLLPQNDSLATYTKLLKRDDGFIPFEVLEKAQKNLPLTIDEIPSLIRDYLEKNKLKEYDQLDLKNSAKIVFNYHRGLHTWPGIWTTIDNKRMKIIDANLIDNKFQINTIQFEGEKSKKSSDLNNY